MKSQILCRSAPSGSRQEARKAWVAIWKSTSSLARMLRYHAGCSSAPPLDATITTSPPMSP